ncbi:cytochrome P450 [Candidatus Bathyarchaeota archaeon]|nr:cytochrome P450 [Candidatus Bathyarchaeota archaeon]
MVGGRRICSIGPELISHLYSQATVAVWQLAANHSSKNFTKPDEFRPERWLGDPEFAQDDQAAMQPFSVGPRNCIGRK